MKNIKLSLKDWLLLSTSALSILFLFLWRQETKRVPKPVEVKISTPVITGSFDPVYNPAPVFTTPKQVMPKNQRDTIVKYITEKVQDTSLQSMIEFMTKYRTYEETFTNKNLSITVKSEVQGFLDKQSVDYYILPQHIDTTITVPVKKSPTSLFIGGDINYNYINKSLTPGARAYLLNKNKLYSLGAYSNKSVSFGVNIKLF